ncbi:MAG: hypothetical protein IPH68_15620 [Chitinophagaceae bacterium]|nr:hypothetical protein [Chitinophagaceae bacterium]
MGCVDIWMNCTLHVKLGKRRSGLKTNLPAAAVPAFSPLPEAASNALSAWREYGG